MLGVLRIFGLILALAATVLLFIFILPDKKRAKLPGILKVVHDIFNFKTLFLEKVLQALYIFTTLACISIGFLMLFGFESSYYGGTHWYGGQGLLLMLLGPIVVRISYEIFMLFVLLVKNVIQINNKLKNQNDTKADDVFVTDVKETFNYAEPKEEAFNQQN